MNKKITLGPRVPIIVMSVLLIVMGVGGAFLDASGQTKPLHSSLYLEWLGINLLGVCVAYWWGSKAMAIKDWENWAQVHSGKYERPTDSKYILGYGIILDKLSGTNPYTKKPFFLYRTFKAPIFTRVPTERFVSSSVILTDEDELSFPPKVLQSKSYLIRVPSVEEMLNLDRLPKS